MIVGVIIPVPAQVQLRRATVQDVPALVHLRSLMFSSMGSDVGGHDAEWRVAAAGWFRDQLTRPRQFAGFVIEHPVDGVVSAALGSCDARAPGPNDVSGTQGHVFNISTEPDVRLPTVRELGSGFVPYSPLGRGFLTGRFRTPDDFAEGDYRRSAPRFQGENFDRNLQLVDRVKEMATEKGCTVGQLALAWLLAQGEDIVPIPGTKKRSRLEENLGAIDVTLSANDLSRLDELAPAGVAAGDRYASMATIDR